MFKPIPFELTASEEEDVLMAIFYAKQKLEEESKEVQTAIDAAEAKTPGAVAIAGRVLLEHHNHWQARLSATETRLKEARKKEAARDRADQRRAAAKHT
jgi:hypothetical protein